MKKPLPYPVEKYIPQIYLNPIDAAMQAMVNKINTHLLTWEAETLGLYYLLDPMRCPQTLLDELGYYLSAGIVQSDSELTKRKKIAGAIARHKVRGSWVYDAKPQIDAITGYDARLPYAVTAIDQFAWVEVGDGVLEVGTNWATEGDGVDATYLGILETGPGQDPEPEVMGNIYINLHYGYYTAILSAAVIKQIVDTIRDDIDPAYMRVILGYIDASGFFQLYVGGVI